ncbi:MAG TPA: YihY/virulence factor BrkB family protein [Miltoncostaea sp.]|nr:YihY/virulence factor BrkB family protein [Miltoncostaea sp.]
MLVEWIRRSLARFTQVAGSRQSAAIAYYVLLSLFPLILFLASVAGLVLRDASLRADFVSALADALPVTESGTNEIENALKGVSENAGTIGIISLVTLLWTASGMMGAIRGSLDAIDPDTPPRPFARGKIVDLIMLGGAAVLLSASAGLTVATRVAGEQLQDQVGFGGLLYDVAREVVPVAVGTGLLILLLRYAPSGAPKVRDIWPAALVGSILLWGLSVGFASFIDAFGRYNLVYGSLAAVVVFLFFVYLAANIVLLSGAFAAEWRGVRTREPGTGPPGPGIGAELLAFVRGLWVPEQARRTPPEQAAPTAADEISREDVDPEPRRSSRG